MAMRDTSQAAELEKQTFPDAWPERSFCDCLAMGHSCWVIATDDRLIGYAIMIVEKGYAHIMNMCVHPEYMGRGNGRRLLEHLLDQARQAPVRIVTLEVRSSNEVALNLYRSCGFVRIGVRASYYPGSDGGEDAVVMAWTP